MDKERLRTGYTTGSCSAAAAKAAAMELILGESPARVELILPEGQAACWEPVKAEGAGISGTSDDDARYADYWKVQKDAGDDPDVTNGSWIYAKVLWITQEELEEKKRYGKGYWSEDYPFIYLDGGPGIGLATLPGLSCPVGHYAINPVPRKMIFEAVASVYVQKYGGTSCGLSCVSRTSARENVSDDSAASADRALYVRLAVPAGVELAEKTFNPKLGIRGGISVLGTTGIVRPMSEEALLETIRLDIHMKAVSGYRTVILTPGNYGETYLKEALGLPLGEAVTCSNFVAASAGMLAAEGIRRVLFAGHIGKMIKAAAGMPNTHSKYGDMRMETLSKITDEVLDEMNVGSVFVENRRDDMPEILYDDEPEKCRTGISEKFRDICEKIVNMVRMANTTDEAVGYLKTVQLPEKPGEKADGGEYKETTLAELVLQRTAQLVKLRMERWSNDQVNFEVIVFSSANQCSGSTADAKRLFDEWKDGDGI